jgi:hypothetical protein
MIVAACAPPQETAPDNYHAENKGNRLFGGIGRMLKRKRAA